MGLQNIKVQQFFINFLKCTCLYKTEHKFCVGDNLFEVLNPTLGYQSWAKEGGKLNHSTSNPKHFGSTVLAAGFREDSLFVFLQILRFHAKFLDDKLNVAQTPQSITLQGHGQEF